ncbi:MAG: hypothetical protein U1E27_09700, partial [Kiritimatiellia bacterium]|nr:hypothetical protein [Kiritimatiellia bacterium]
MKRMTWLAAVVGVGLVFAAGVARSADSTWTNTAGGLYHDPANWSAGVPGDTDRASFITVGTYLVTFTNDVSSRFSMGSASPNVTFDLGGFTYTRPSPSPGFALDVMNNAQWTITNGTFLSQFTMSMAYNGNYASMTSRVTVGQGALFRHTGTNFNIGYRYAAEFNVVNGGKLVTDVPVAGDIRVGRTEGGLLGTGTLLVDGAGSVWTNLNTANAASQIQVADSLGATGTISVLNGGLVVHKGGNVSIGYRGIGNLNVTGGSTFDASDPNTGAIFYIGQDGGAHQGVGTALVSGENSKLLLGANNRSFSFTIGSSAGATGTLTVADQGQVVHKGRNMIVGNSGSGTLIIQSGGELDATGLDNNYHLYFGNASGSVGSVTVTGSNSILRVGTSLNRNQLLVGSSAGSQGTLTVADSGKVVFTGTNLFIASSGTGTLNIHSGGVFDARQMDVASVFYVGNANGAVGTVNIDGVGSELLIGENIRSNVLRVGNSAGSSGTINISNGGKLVHAGSDVTFGSAGVGALYLTSGGVFDAWDMVPGRSTYIGNTTNGLVSISGAGSQYRNAKQSTMYMGFNTGIKGTLIIEDGGTFTGGTNGIYGGYRGQADILVRTGGLFHNAIGSGPLYLGSDPAASLTVGGLGFMAVSGTTSRAIGGDWMLGNRSSTGTVVVADGGTLDFYRQVIIGAGQTNALGIYNAKGTVLVTGTGSVLRSTALTSVELPFASFTTASGRAIGVGAAAWGGGWHDGGLWIPGEAGGTNQYVRSDGTLIVEKGGLVDAGAGRLAVFSNSLLRIDGGRALTTQLGMETGSVFNVVLNLGDANADALLTASGEVRLWGATLQVELADGYAPAVDDVFTLISFGTLNSPYNRFSYGGSILEDEATFTVGSTDFQIDYFNNNVYLTVIP